MKRVAIIVGLALLLVSGCRARQGRDEENIILPQDITSTPAPFNPPTLTPTSALNSSLPDGSTSTALPTSVPAQPPAPPPVPPAVPTDIPIRLLFDLGGTQTTVHGPVAGGSSNSYVIGARQGQLMIVNVISTVNDVHLSIFGVSDGSVLVVSSSATSSWSGSLPATQDYIIRTVAGGGTSTYELRISIPARVEFDAGATAAHVEGDIASGMLVDYVLRLLAGQVMDVRIVSPSPDVVVSVTTVNGTPINSLIVDATLWRASLPSSQDYIISVATTSGSTNYALDISVPARVVFDVGATVETVEGSVGAGGSVAYILQALAGQTMTVTITVGTDDLALNIFGLADGSLLLNGDLGESVWTGTLNATQNYVIEVVSSGAAADYTLEIDIQ